MLATIVLLDLNVIIDALLIKPSVATGVANTMLRRLLSTEALLRLLSAEQNQRRYSLAVSMSTASERAQSTIRLHRQLAKSNLTAKDITILPTDDAAKGSALRIIASGGSQKRAHDAQLISDLSGAGGGILLTNDEDILRHADLLNSELNVRPLSPQGLLEEASRTTIYWGAPALVAYEQEAPRRINDTEGKFTMHRLGAPIPCNCHNKHKGYLIEARMKDPPSTQPGIYTITLFSRLGETGSPFFLQQVGLWAEPYQHNGRWTLRGHTHFVELMDGQRYEAEPCRVRIPINWKQHKVHFSPDGHRTVCGLDAQAHRSTDGPLVVVNCKNCLQVVTCPYPLELAASQLGSRLRKSTWVCWDCEEDHHEEEFDLVKGKVVRRTYMAQAYRKQWQRYRDIRHTSEAWLS